MKESRTYPEYDISSVLVAVRECLRGSVGGGHLASCAVEAGHHFGNVEVVAVIRGILVSNGLFSFRLSVIVRDWYTHLNTDTRLGSGDIHTA